MKQTPIQLTAGLVTNRAPSAQGLRRSRRKAHGYTFIEIVGSLAVIALGVAIISGVGEDVMSGSDTSRAIAQVKMVRGAASLYAAPGDFAGMTMARLSVGNSVGTGTGTNPWGGNYTVTVNNSGADYTLSITAVPEDASVPLLSTLGIGSFVAAAYNATTDVVTVGYDR